MKKVITAGIALGFAMLPFAARAQVDTGTTSSSPTAIQDTEDYVANWVNERDKISKARNEWKTEKELLKQRIDLYQSEYDDLQEKIAGLAKNRAQGADKRAELQQKLENLQHAQSVVEGQLGAYERQLINLSAYFPSPLQKTISTLAARLPKDKRAADKISASNRLATIVAILNEVDKFNNEVTVVQEVRTVGGEQRQVNVMYLGLGQAFYADASGKFGGVGTPAKGQWAWTEKSGQAASIARAIDVAKGVIKPAKFVTLPLQVTDIPAAQ